MHHVGNQVIPDGLAGRVLRRVVLDIGIHVEVARVKGDDGGVALRDELVLAEALDVEHEEWREGVDEAEAAALGVEFLRGDAVVLGEDGGEWDLGDDVALLFVLGERDEFRVTYASVRRQQKELLMPSSLSFTNEDIGSLNQLLEGIAGFALLEKATMRKTGNFRSPTDVDELWDSMCKKAISIITPALENITTADTLLKVKNVLALFIQTMDVGFVTFIHPSPSNQYVRALGTLSKPGRVRGK